MGDKIELTLEERSVVGKAVKALRKQGYVPAVVYGNGLDAQAVMAPQMHITKAYRAAGKHQPVELQLGKQKRLAMIKSADFDPVKHTLRHVAFHAIKQGEKVETEVPIVIVGEGETPAEKTGLVVLTTIETVQVSALPNDLPDNVEAPGEKLVEIGDHLTVADLKVPHGVAVLSEPEQVVATVYEPSALAAQNESLAGEAEAGQEVEVPSEEGGESAEEGEDANEKKENGEKS